MKYSSLEKMFIYDEGFNIFPYQCSAGKWTIGIGHNIEANPIPGKSLEYLQKHGITEAQALELLHHELSNRAVIARQYSWFRGLNEARQAVILNILYIRPASLKEWAKYKPELIKALDAYQFREAANLMKELKIAKQLKNRFNRLCSQFEKGEWLDAYKNFEPKT